MRRMASSLGFFVFFVGSGLAAIAPGCVDGGGTDNNCPPGAEGCTCYANNLCATGLTCVSGFCVDLSDANDDDDDETGGDGDDNSTGDGDPTGDGDGDEDVNLCQLLIECVKEVQPEALSSYVTLYGPEGECYDIPGLTEKDCWNECDAIRESLAEANPNVAECASYNCGDGKLDSDEMCDGTEGCTAVCKYSTTPVDENRCNPITQVGCDIADERCGLSIGQFNSFFVCRDNGAQPPNASRSEECFADADCNDPNALCLPRPDCVSNGCCTLTCYLGSTDEDFGACPAGYTCTPIPDIFGTVWADGSDLIGLCW